MDDLNKLNKNQIVLLTLLVSFVTSIATGIVTVTLIQQAPPEVRQPVERVVLKTVERVVESGKTQTVIKEVPVIVTEEQLIIKVVNNASPSVITIQGLNPETKTEVVFSAGFVAAPDLVVASGQANFNPKETYTVVTADGQKIEAKVVSDPVIKAVTVLRLASPTVAPPLSLAADLVAIGQTVVAVGSTGLEAGRVAVGIVSGDTPGDDIKPATIRTSAANIDNIGAPLLNIQGKVVALSAGAGVAVAYGVVGQAIDSVKK